METPCIYSDEGCNHLIGKYVLVYVHNGGTLHAGVLKFARQGIVLLGECRLLGNGAWTIETRHDDFFASMATVGVQGRAPIPVKERLIGQEYQLIPCTPEAEATIRALPVSTNPY